MARSLPRPRWTALLAALGAAAAPVAAAAWAQQDGAPRAAAPPPPPPAMLVPRDVRPGEITSAPGMTVPERVIPAPRGEAGADARPAPSSSEARVAPGGGDPGILAPMPAAPQEKGPAGTPHRPGAGDRRGEAR